MSDFDYQTSGERLNNSQREQLLDQVKQQVALASAQELIQACERLRPVRIIKTCLIQKLSVQDLKPVFTLMKMSDKCFKKCIHKPGASLDSSEQKCLAMCMDRYMDSWNLISRTYSSRLQREHGAGSSFQ